MGSFSIWHWLIVLVLILLLFGRGKVSELMGDLAKGIKTFKKGMAEDETEDKAQTIEHDSTAPIASEAVEKKTKEFTFDGQKFKARRTSPSGSSSPARAASRPPTRSPRSRTADPGPLARACRDHRYTSQFRAGSALLPGSSA